VGAFQLVILLAVAQRPLAELAFVGPVGDGEGEVLGIVLVAADGYELVPGYVVLGNKVVIRVAAAVGFQQAGKGMRQFSVTVRS